jgi:hypothetical protein
MVVMVVMVVMRRDSWEKLLRRGEKSVTPSQHLALVPFVVIIAICALLSFFVAVSKHLNVVMRLRVWSILCFLFCLLETLVLSDEGDSSRFLRGVPPEGYYLFIHLGIFIFFL